jgi:hypothetical protein
VGAMFDDLSDHEEGFLEMFLHFLDGTLAPRGVPGAVVEPDEEPEPPPVRPEDKDDPFRS